MNRSWKVGQSRTFVDGERITVYRETQPGCHEVLMRDKHGPVVFSCRADAQAVADAINAAAPEPPAPGVGEEGAQNWQGMDGAIAFHLIERHAEGWNQVGEMMEAWRAANTPAPSAGVSVSEADPVLLKFYGVDNVPALIAAQSEHIEKLQDAARRNVKPWEDTFPPTLLPKYLRDNGLPAPTPPTVVVVQTATFCPACGEATGNPECFICAATPPAPSAGVSVSEGEAMAIAWRAKADHADKLGHCLAAIAMRGCADDLIAQVRANDSGVGK
jgi:hypothetical protein